MTEARNHHFVSQCYLKGFAEAPTKNAMLHVWDFPSRKRFKTKPRNVAAMRDFGRIDVDGKDPNALEKALGQFESQLAPALERTIQAGKFTNDDDFATIINFVLLAHIRHPTMRDFFSNFTGHHTRDTLLERFSSEEAYDVEIKKLEQASGKTWPKVTYAEMKEFLESNRYKIVIDRTHINTVEMDTFNEFLPLLFKHSWTLWRTDSVVAPFITSDKPVGLVWSNQETAPAGIAPGLASLHSHLFMPLSKDLMLSGSHERPPAVLQAPPDIVAAMNAYQIGQARSQIYAPHTRFKYMTSTTEGVRGASNLFTDIKQDFDERQKSAAPLGIWG